MKNCFLIFSLLFTTLLFSQNPEIKSELPTIIPPSPTVSSLMKFEEVPVSNYTGIPDVNVPIINLPTHSKDVKVDMSLKYHAGSVNANEFASYTGLGWNLIAGGTISRTVRGLPDEILIDQKQGIHQNDHGANSNNYYQFSSLAGGVISKNVIKDYNRFLWENQYSGLYDSEHDLYQYNFMGNTGRFIIVKNNGNYEVHKLDNDNNTLIEYDHETKNFTIYDDKGIKYFFDVKETTTESTAASNTWFDNTITADLSNSINYTSAFHLSKIYDQNNNKLVEIIYNNESLMESTTVSSSTVSKLPYRILDPPFDIRNYPDQITKWDPNLQEISSLRSISTKKMKQLLITDIAKIEFTNESGREDDQLNRDAVKLKNITIKDWLNNTIKSYNFIYSYSTVLRKRMMLEKVIENDGSSGSYSFSYFKSVNQTDRIGKDYWGYFNQNPINFPAKPYMEVDPEICKTDVLETLTYPTKGTTTFVYEPNQYSYEGNHALTNFDDNPENWNNSYNTLFFKSRGGASPKQNLNFSLTENQRVSFDVTSSFVDGQEGSFSLSKINSDNTEEFIMFIGDDTTDGMSPFNGITLQAGVQYAIRFHWFNSEFLGYGNVAITYKIKNAIQKNYLIGGGIRIKEIKYSDGFSPIMKSKKFNYNNIGNQLISSGSLAYPKPIFDFEIVKKVYYEEKPGSIVMKRILLDAPYKKHTTSNNILAIRTKGSDVGYKNVSVYETDNGKSEFVYTNAQDYPEEMITISYPFLPAKNFDYKRGLLLNEVKKDNYNRKLSETAMTYEIDETEKKTGVRTFVSNSCPYLYQHATFEGYWGMLPLARANPDSYPHSVCGEPNTIFGYLFIYEAFGWAKLSTKVTTNYFYSGSETTPTSLINFESYSYNPTNKKIQMLTTTTSNDEKVITNYVYHERSNPSVKNRISEIESITTQKNNVFRDVFLLSKSTINYSNLWQNYASYLPSSVMSAKGANIQENRIEYSHYNTFGNPLELKQSNGIPITYIWGYNQTQPIAKIENATYAQVQQYEANLQALSNGTDENALTAALNALRTNLPNAMITTYTYIPLVGVRTITDPKGLKTTYEYDAFNRLKWVKDQDGNVLQKYCYNYKGETINCQ